ncbi:unnamed protein product, partial [Ascophyllum nodosum]
LEGSSLPSSPYPPTLLFAGVDSSFTGLPFYPCSKTGGMFQLRRAIANLWTPAPQNDEGGNGTATPTEHTSPQAPRSLVGEACDPEEEESSRADHKRGEEESSAPGMQHGSLPPPIREIRL